MSYWYERFAKKHILVFLLSVLIAFMYMGFQYAGSYVIGCTPTASRTLYDWISVERSDNNWEIYPYVQMHLETGCTEWLGFSTCETVQFQNWMPIWLHNEIVSIHIFNVTNEAQAETGEIAPIVVDRVNSDGGTSVSSGGLNLKRAVTYNYNFDVSRFDETITTGNPRYVSGASTNPWMKVRLGEALGATQGGLVYLDISPGHGDRAAKHENDAFVLPAATNKMLRSRSLFYFLSTSADHRRCLFDEDCAQQCTWTGPCEPLSYGHHGTLMPSATLFFTFKPAQELGHWPIPAWDYKLYCPKTEFDESCLNERSRQVVVFNPETFSRSIFFNTGYVALDKFPDVEFQLWKSTGYARRDEGCNSPGLVLGYQGKDCGVPYEYVFVGDGLFVSSPRPAGGDAAMMSEIHSERVTGLRFDYLNVWQVNRRLTLTSNAEQVDKFLPLFWIKQQPLTIKLNEDLQFSAFKDYVGSMFILEVIFLAGYAACYVAFFYIFSWSTTCCGYLAAMEAEALPFKPQYF